MPSATSAKIDPAQAASSSGSTYFQGMQIFRGFAALGVMLYHSNIYMQWICQDKSTFLRFFVPQLARGWCFFFVISGFLMSYLINSGTRYFLPRRLLRIYPTFWIAMTCVIAFRMIVFDAHFPHLTGRIVLLLPLVNEQKAVNYPLSVEWTLVYEIFFYLICACFNNRYLRRLFPAFLFLWLIVIGCAAIFSPAHNFTFPNFSEIWISTNNVLFIGGALAFYVYRALPAIKWRWLIPAYALAALFFIAGERTIQDQGFFFQLATRIGMIAGYPSIIFYTLGFTFLLVPWLAAEKNHAKLPGLTPFEKLGDYSYALYLIHVPVITSLYTIASIYHGNRNALAALTLLITLTIGTLLGHLDVRIHNRLKGIFGKKRQPPRNVADTASPAPKAESPPSLLISN